jgi:hypothetical protein
VSCAAGVVLPDERAVLGVIRGPLDAAAAIPMMMNRATTDRRPIRTLWPANQERRGPRASGRAAARRTAGRGFQARASTVRMVPVHALLVRTDRCLPVGLALTWLVIRRPWPWFLPSGRRLRLLAWFRRTTGARFARPGPGNCRGTIPQRDRLHGLAAADSSRFPPRRGAGTALSPPPEMHGRLP